MILYFIRHGKTLYNKEHIYQGLCDSPLLPEGIEIAKKIGAYLKNKNINVIYASPLKRSRDTAEIINKRLNKKVFYKNILKEVCYGQFEGKKREDLKKLPIWRERENNKFDFINPGKYKGGKGQSYKEKFESLKKFFEKISKSKKNYLIIGHTGISMAAYNFFNKSEKKPTYKKFKNNEIFCVKNASSNKYEIETLVF